MDELHNDILYVIVLGVVWQFLRESISGRQCCQKICWKTEHQNNKQQQRNGEDWCRVGQEEQLVRAHGS